MFLTACGGESKFEDLKTHMKNLRQSSSSKKPAPQKVITLDTPDAAIYRSGDKRMPFGENANLPDGPIASRNPLQAYPLNMLRFVGVITREGANSAFIAGPDGMTHEVKVGDRIGDRLLEVVEITNNEVNVREEVREAGKPPSSRIITLQLKESQ